MRTVSGNLKIDFKRQLIESVFIWTLKEFLKRHLKQQTIAMKFLFLLLFTAITVCSYSQLAGNSFADTAFIYKGFGSGGTTANLWFYSKAVDTIQSVTKSQLDTEYLDTLNYLIEHVKSKRHFQQKIGPSFYASIIKDGRERRIAIVPNWAIIDLENKRQFVFRGTPYFEIYYRFVDEEFR